MVKKIIQFSVNHKLIIGVFVFLLIVGGILSLQRLPIDAVPDITNNQVQVVTVSSSLAAQEVEQFITYPVEVTMSNIPNVIEIRSISRYGLSVVTIVFEDHIAVLQARQLVQEQINIASGEIPEGLGTPELMPITTGLGEIYQYVLEIQPGYESRYDAMQLRTIQDWIVKRQLAGTKGIIEVSSFGGYLKQYEVGVDPILLRSMNVSVSDVFDALKRNNQNSGGSYIEKTSNAYYIRTEGIVKNIDDILSIVVSNNNGIPVLVRDVAKVQFGSPKRFGAMTMDGKGEAVGGITLMLKGANSSEALEAVKDRIELVKRSLPEGLTIYPYLDRSQLVAKTINTVKNNLLEGGIIVVLVLILLLGDLRAGLIVASIIPLSMLFAIILMNYFGISANLMSLGAIDFGIVVDGAVILVEGVVYALFAHHVGKRLSQKEMDFIVIDTSTALFKATIFGVFIILIVFVPIITLTGIEGKMFRPMALTFSFAVLGALVLSLTYVPAVTSMLMPKNIRDRNTMADRFINFLKRLYRPVLRRFLSFPYLVLAGGIGVFIATFLIFKSLGAVFIPTLEEGDLAMQMAVRPGSSLSESVRSSTKAESVLLEHFPEVKHVVSKIGTAEVPTDPMAIEDADIMIILDEKKNWKTAKTREGLVDKMKEKLDVIAGASFEFTQPIQLRFNELMTGAKTDISVKIFGENLETLKRLADSTVPLLEKIRGAADVKVEQTEGLPQLMIKFDRQMIARYGLQIEDLNTLIRTAYAGEVAGVVFENERKFDLVVRFNDSYREDVILDQLYVPLPFGGSIPVSEVASVDYTEGPMQISRESARRFINVGINVRNRDIASLVNEVEATLSNGMDLPPGYSISYGGEFENLRKAQRRLSLAVPVAFFLIFIMLFFAFGKLKYGLIIFTAVPLSAFGGTLALWVRGMPFSISAGVGFIALFGVAVLNGIVLISYLNKLREENGYVELKNAILEGGATRLRPVLMTASVAALGFLPMALSTTNGAEVQKPLATVVIGGLLTEPFITLLILPVLYMLVNRNIMKKSITGMAALILIVWIPMNSVQSQNQVTSLEDVIEMAREKHPALANARIKMEQATLLKDQARQMPATEFSLELGQINSNLLDYSFGVQQGFGNPSADKQKRKVAAATYNWSETEFNLLEHQLEMAIRQAWDYWIYFRRKAFLFQQKHDILVASLEKTQVYYNAGELSGLELTIANNRVIQNQRAIEAAYMEEQTAFIQLKKTAYLEDTIAINFDSYPVMDFPGDDTLDIVWTDPIRKKLLLAQEETRLFDKMDQPEFSVGYFNQSIRPDYSFQGVSTGVSIPLWRKQFKAKVEESKLEEQKISNELDWQKQSLENERKRVWQEMTSLFRQLQEYGTQLVEQQEQIISISRKKWQNGEIDFFAYQLSLDEALENELMILDISHAFNQSVIQWDLLNK